MLRPSTLALSAALAALLALPAAAQRSGPYRAGSITVYAEQVSGPPCRLDFIIESSDNDYHAIQIEYTIEGYFATGMPDRYEQGSRTRRLITDAGPLTWGGRYHRKSADMSDLYCSSRWSHGAIRLYEENASAAKRQHDEDVRRKNEEKIAERERKKRELEESQRRAKQTSEDIKRQQEQYQWKGIEAYRRANPRCLVNDQADIARCEQAKRIEAEGQRAEDARRAQEREKAEFERRERERQRQQARQSERDAELSRNNPCAYAAQLRGEPLPGNPSGQHRKALEAQRKQAQAAHDKQCEQWKAQQAGGSTPPPPSGPSAAQLKAEAERRAAAERLAQREKAQRELQQSLQSGQSTVSDSAARTGAMRDENAELQRMLNNLK